MTGAARRTVLLLLQAAPLLLFVVLLAVFGTLSGRFLSGVNFVNILIQAAHIGIIGIGMTFVLLVGGIDLSVGANMYVGAAIMGLYLTGLPLVVSFPVVAVVGLAFGAVNAFFVTRLRVPAFIVTLATLFVGRGIALYLTGSKLIPLGNAVLVLGRSSYFGVPSAIWAFAVVLRGGVRDLARDAVRTPGLCRGGGPRGRRQGGHRCPKILFSVYCICGVCAAIGGLVSASQVAVASSTFGYQKEFPVIAAAVLGGTSLFGGRGGVLGTVFGAVLIQTVENGLVMTNANPYVYPLVISAIIFVAVFVDGVRTAILERLERRQIRVERA